MESQRDLNRVICRFHNPDAAKAVLAEAKKTTSVPLYVDRVPHSDTREDPPGDYAICTDADLTKAVTSRSTMSACIANAIQLALARALERVRPSDPLLTIWHLKSENVPRAYRFGIDRL